MAKSEWSFKSAVELAAALSAKKVSAVELTRDAIARIERHDGRINAICVRDFDRALGAAREADAALARGERKPLLGLPVTVKESFNIAGLPTTWGFPPQRNFKPAEDALPVARIKQAGGVILGKTNVPVGLGDWQSYNDIYGTTNNPYDLGRTPGGSSGGSSAALAAGYCALATGSDIGGSLRVPAFHCGIFAHKPTLNLCPARGETPPPFPAIPREDDLAVIGPMARTATDLTLLLDVLAGPEPLDAGVAYELELPAARHHSLRDFRVLVIDSHPLLPTDGDVRGAIDRLATDLSKAGTRIARESGQLPDFAETSRLYMRMLLSFLGAFFLPDELVDAQTRASQLSPEDRSLGAERLRGITASHRAWVLDAGARAGLRAQWRALFKSFDAVICPIMPTPAFPHDHSPDQNLRRISIDGKDYPYSDQLAWPGIATLPGLPSTAVPLGLSKGGLPVGVQIVGPWLEDRTPLKLAELIEREFGGFVPPKMFDD
ncbi:amidase [Bradyrhizobium sp. WBOS7]|uniref:Amidase n=1 Tax=Bradyrhizobium betae TaxID=244734 RepID=A0AAE9N5X3_9BRAD|nr:MULTISPECIES: amidase [Bradyrhizobium]MDD1574536.1 amidase [Bradyrhizobium sp. WBOS1]UUO34709.1 amidase [Bradyrhizobium sp. WBOS01]MDD1530989.1 amidase [Bradyrhizobium sp. WBOS2]MDD1580572.1 amidase [Bradyrhizobium sp. WBOS7]MDD1603878.1 amidase [Bradyrhizobium sp. WBOS16]